jgi:hypothetical protein
MSHRTPRSVCRRIVTLSPSHFARRKIGR